VILPFNFEELRALRAGARSLLGRHPATPDAPVLAPSESRARLESLEPRLTGDLSLGTLAELRGVEAAVAAIVEYLRAEMEARVVTTHPAGEEAVAAYFDFAHALSAQHRLEGLSAEMTALAEVVTGRPVDEETARTFRFPD